MRFNSVNEVLKSYKVLSLDAFHLNDVEYRLATVGARMDAKHSVMVSGNDQPKQEFASRFYRQWEAPYAKYVEVLHHPGDCRPVDILTGENSPTEGTTFPNLEWMFQGNKGMLAISMKLHDMRATDRSEQEFTEEDRRSESLYRKFAKLLGITITESRNLACRNVNPGKYLAWTGHDAWLARIYDGEQSLTRRFENPKDAVDWLTA